MSPTIEDYRSAQKEAAKEIADLRIFASDHETGVEPTLGRRRRLRYIGAPDPVGVASLVLTEEGVLVWHDGPPGRSLRGRRSGRPGSLAPSGEVVDVYEYEKLEPNQVADFLRRVDEKLTPQVKVEGDAPATRGRLRRLPKKKLTKAELAADDFPTVVPGEGRKLVLIHGTFSNTRNLLAGIAEGDSGFLERAVQHYDEVLTFDHPTVSLSPIMNAFDLSRLFAGVGGPIDVVAHSRGGLVTRWWLEGFGVPNVKCRAVLVGSPLGGTSLAAPPRLKDAMSILSNLATALKFAGTVAAVYLPLLEAPLFLLKVAGTVLSAGARTPVLDAAVALVPGLAGQSRVARHPELTRIRGAHPGPAPEYHVITSNFESEEAGWRFWKYFRKDKLADIGADAVFPGENDLVVDTESMSELSPG
ncbi:MAG TPA: hypothetical protein VII47_13505, partial [Actinomycetota bacterium]